MLLVSRPPPGTVAWWAYCCRRPAAVRTVSRTSIGSTCGLLLEQGEASIAAGVSAWRARGGRWLRLRRWGVAGRGGCYRESFIAPEGAPTGDPCEVRACRSRGLCVDLQRGGSLPNARRLRDGFGRVGAPLRAMRRYREGLIAPEGAPTEGGSMHWVRLCGEWLARAGYGVAGSPLGVRTNDSHRHATLIPARHRPRRHCCRCRRCRCRRAAPAIARRPGSPRRAGGARWCGSCGWLRPGSCRPW